MGNTKSKMAPAAALVGLAVLLCVSVVYSQPDQLPQWAQQPPGGMPPGSNFGEKPQGTYDLYPFLPFAAHDRLLVRLTPSWEQLYAHPLHFLVIFLPALLLGIISARIHRSLPLLMSSMVGFTLSEVANMEPRKRGLPYMLFSIGFSFITGLLCCRTYLMSVIGLPLFHDILARLPEEYLYKLPSWLIDLS